MIRVLHVVSVMDVGGMESFIMNMYRLIDRSEFQFDFLVHHKRRGKFEDEIEALGGKVYHTSLMDDRNLLRYRTELKQLFQAHPEYRIVHGHLGSTAVWYLGEAEKQGVPWRILHSHCPSHLHSLKGEIKHVLFYFSPRHANVSLACSTEAGEYQFKGKSFEVIPNGINVTRFAYNESLRNECRSRLGISNQFVIGHVGRFYYEKNHPYILRVFQRVRIKIPDSVLLLVGDGELLEQTKKLVREMQLQDSVIFTGLQGDVAPFYQAMDAFILPSLYEGLPLTGIEAQCSGLPCLFSASVSPEILISSAGSFIPIGEDHIEDWAKALVKLYSGKEISRAMPANVCDFDIEHITKAMTGRYLNMLEERP